jgi:CHAT domain-containing protein
LPFVGFGDPLFAIGTETSDKPDIRVRELQVSAPKDVLQHVVDQAQQSTQPLVQETRPNLPTLAQAFSLLPPLPDTADELSEIALTLGASPQDDLYLGARASKANVKRVDLSRYRVIAFATHGLEAGELSGLDEPALALANPELTHESGDDGFLKLEDVLGLKLNADWVILSACNTASSDGSSNEAVSGLGRGFFYAGARSVLVSNWAVESRSARLLTTGLFIEQASHPDMTRAEALRRSMVNLMKRYPAEYGHPVFWGAFSVVGDGR